MFWCRREEGFPYQDAVGELHEPITFLPLPLCNTIQGYSLLVSLLMVVSNLVYFEPQTTHCTFQKHKFEKEIGAGQAIGKVEEDKTQELRKNPEYAALENKFVRLHSYASIANLVALAAQAIHLWYLAGHLDTI